MSKVRTDLSLALEQVRLFPGATAAWLAGGLGAEAVELVLVPQHLEAAQPDRHLLLQALDLVVLELEDEIALHADQVVVMGAADLVARLAVVELARAGDPAVEQEAQRAVHRRVADARV